MSDFDLDSEIKSIRVPPRDQEYWDDFAGRVMARARTAPVTSTAQESFAAGLWWAVRLAMACLMLEFCLWESGMPRHVSHVLRRDEQQLRQSVARLDSDLGRLMRDEHGLHKLVEDQP
jgi:hypothetical protein